MRVILGILVGIIPGLCLIYASVSAGPAVLILGGIIGGLTALERIGPLRFLALGFTASVGSQNGLKGAAHAVLDATEEKDKPTDVSDRLTKWLFEEGSDDSDAIGNGWMLVSVIGGALIGWGFAYLDWQSIRAGGHGWLVSTSSREGIGTQMAFVSFCASVFYGSVSLLFSTRSARRQTIALGLLGWSFGFVITISMGSLQKAIMSGCGCSVLPLAVAILVRSIAYFESRSASVTIGLAEPERSIET